MVLHSCEGTEDPTNKTVQARQALQQYADAGGRVFASHWHNYWIEHGAAPWPTLAKFKHQRDPASPFTSTIDTSFDKGMALRDWLVNVGASTTPGQLVIQGAKHTVHTINPPSQRWIYSTMPISTQYFSFVTPVTAGARANDSSAPANPFFTGCVTQVLSPQEKTLEFMIFDLSSCVIEIG